MKKDSIDNVNCFDYYFNVYDYKLVYVYNRDKELIGVFSCENVVRDSKEFTAELKKINVKLFKHNTTRYFFN